MIPIAFDPGYGSVVAALAAHDGPHTAVVPSVVGVGQTDLGLLSLGTVGRRARRTTPDRVTFDGVTYLVGEGVARYARPVQRMDMHRLSEGPEVRALFYAALARLLGAGDHRAIALMVGLPVEVMADRKAALATLRGLRGWIVDRHEYAVNGEEMALDIENVRAMAQPAGAYFAWGLDDEGNWTRGGKALKSPVAVCDVGFNTLDLFAVQNGEVTRRYTDGETVGMRRAAEALAAAVRTQHGVTLSLHEADALIREKKPVLNCAAGEVDLSAERHQALDVTAGEVVQFIEQRWENGRQFAHLLFTGGGSAALRDWLTRQYPHGVVLPDPVTANAVGLARYARRLADKDN